MISDIFKNLHKMLDDMTKPFEELDKEFEIWMKEANSIDYDEKVVITKITKDGKTITTKTVTEVSKK